MWLARVKVLGDEGDGGLGEFGFGRKEQRTIQTQGKRAKMRMMATGRSVVRRRLTWRAVARRLPSPGALRAPTSPRRGEVEVIGRGSGRGR